MKQFYLLAFLFLSLNINAAPPTMPASNLSFNIIEGNFFNVGWTAGNGVRRIMIVRAGQPVSAIPQNGVDYAENTNFGSGQAILPGQYVVYDNAFTSFFLTGLSPATQYFFAVYEYNGTGASIEYLTSSFLSGSAFTVSAPTVPPSNITFNNITATSVTVGFTAGNGSRRLVVAREAAPVNSNPIDLQPYSGNNIFGSGAELGTGNFAVYSSSGTTVTVTNLKAGTQYFFAVYEYNGNGQPVYNVQGIAANVTTRTVPTVPSGNVIITKADGKELSLSWTSGNGQRRIVVAKQSTTLTGIPANGTDYVANDIFGSGAILSSGEFVVYSGTGNSAIVKGLNPATTYHFRIFEYDGTGNNALYLTGLFAAASGTTASTPTQQAGNITAGNVLATTLNLTFNSGNGRARLVVARKNAAVNIIPQDFTVYAANSDFGNGQQIGTGNFVISSTTDPFTVVHNLEPNSTYHFAVFEFNGFNQPLYLSPASVFSVTTLGPVPVKISQWNVSYAAGKVKLKWVTTMEENAEHFSVERSEDGAVFSSIKIIPAMGNSQVPVAYQATDDAPLTGQSYYRLRLVDKDGKSAYTTMVSISINKQLDDIRIIENPVRNMLIVKTAGQPGNWLLVNSGGERILNGKFSTNQFGIAVSKLPPGLYWLKIQQPGKSNSIVFVKQ